MELKNMDLKTQSRWMALLLAIDHIDEYCHCKNKCFDEEVLKPIPIKHFIEEKSKVIEHTLRNQKATQQERYIIAGFTQKIIDELVCADPV